MVEPPAQSAPKLYPYRRSADQEAAPRRHPVIIVGGGPVGLALALDLCRKRVPCLLLDDEEGVGVGSRAICFAKRTLEICDRLGTGEEMMAKGVVWQRGRVFRGEKEIYAFDLQPEAGHRRPAFINLQQTYFEEYLVAAIAREQAGGAPVEIRGHNRVTGLEPRADGIALEIETPEGRYKAEANYLVACDGSHSTMRHLMGLQYEGRVFEDNFLIADIRMHADFPVERRFWFDPPFNPGQTALLHKQPDDVWRTDFQLGWGIDRTAELQEERVRARVAGMIGADIPFDLVWTSIYTFRCATIERYRHGRVLFAGDAAHVVSPFGARGANGGIQDADNLAWKLALVLGGHAGDALLDSYHDERKLGAMENIMNSERTADFLTPHTSAHRLFRDAVLDLAEHHPFARPMVNSGRLSVPATYGGSPLNGPDALIGGPPRTRPGAPCPDAPLGETFLLDRLGDNFVILAIDTAVPDAVADGGIAAHCLSVSAEDDATGALRERYLGIAPSAVYLIRPDQHIAARWPVFDAKALAAALATATGAR